MRGGKTDPGGQRHYRHADRPWIEGSRHSDRSRRFSTSHHQGGQERGDESNWFMIVPVDLPDELLQKIQASASEQGVPFREFVATALQAAATGAKNSGPAHRRAFSQRVHDFGVHLDNPWTALAEIETEDYTSRDRK